MKMYFIVCEFCIHSYTNLKYKSFFYTLFVITNTHTSSPFSPTYDLKTWFHFDTPFSYTSPSLYNDATPHTSLHHTLTRGHVLPGRFRVGTTRSDAGAGWLLVRCRKGHADTSG